MKMIVAVGDGGLIGKEGGLPWNIPDELRLFKRLTEGSKVVMGRKTAESLKKPLKNRENYVLTKSKNFSMDGFNTCSEDEVLEMEGDVFIIGGSSVYTRFVEECEAVIVSFIKGDYEGDTFLDLEFNFTEGEVIMEHEKFTTIEYTK